MPTLLFLSLILLPLGPSIGSQAARATATVKNQILNVRSSASTSSPILCKLTQGTKVTIISETTGADGLKWYDVFFAYNENAYDGFVRADLVTVSGIVSNDTFTVSSVKYVKPSVALIRSYASTQGDIRCRLTAGTSVTILASKTGLHDGLTWYKVSFTKNGNSMQGYIRGDLLTDATLGSSSTASGADEASGIRYICEYIARVRSYASTSADIRSRLIKGTPVILISSKIGDDGMKWYKVAYEDGTQALNGYVRSDLLTEEPVSSPNETVESSSSGSKPAVAQVRSYASPYADIRTTLQNGTKVTILKQKTGEDGQQWSKISFTQNGKTMEGYVPSSLLK